MEDMRAVQLVIDGEAVDTPYNFETAAEGQFRVMFKDISLLITEEGRHTIAFRFHGKDYVPTAIGLSDYEADNMKYTMSLDNEQLIITAEANGNNPGEGVIKDAYKIDFYNNIIAVWFNTENLTQDDMMNVELIIDGTTVVKPYQVEINGAVPSQLRPMYNNIILYLTTTGEHTIQVRCNDQYYIPTEIGDHSYETDTMTYTLSKNSDGQHVITVTSKGGTEKPDPDEGEYNVTLTFVEIYGGDVGCIDHSGNRSCLVGYDGSFDNLCAKAGRAGSLL